MLLSHKTVRQAVDASHFAWTHLQAIKKWNMSFDDCKPTYELRELFEDCGLVLGSMLQQLDARLKVRSRTSARPGTTMPLHIHHGRSCAKTRRWKVNSLANTQLQMLGVRFRDIRLSFNPRNIAAAFWPLRPYESMEASGVCTASASPQTMLAWELQPLSHVTTTPLFIVLPPV